MAAREVRVQQAVVRTAAAADVAAVVAVVTRARAQAMPWLPVLHTHEEDLEFFGGHLLQATDHRAWVAEQDGRVVGFAAMGHGDLAHLYVDPDAQGQGVGSALWGAVQQAAPDGFGFWVFAANEAAQRFYEARGARALYATDGADNEERTPDVRYLWRPA